VPSVELDDRKTIKYSLDFISGFLPQTRQDIDVSFAENEFSRDRKLTLPITIALIINMVRPGKRFGYQEVINRFFSDTGLAHDQGIAPPDKAAFFRARKKVPFDVMSELFQGAVNKATELAALLGVSTWNGHRVLAIDGTKKNMPHSEQLVEAFGVPHGAHYPQMLSCALYDVLAKVPINVMWGANDISERALAQELTEDLGPGDLLLLDRGYPGFELFEKMVKEGIDFLVRLPDNGLFGVIKEFLAKGHRDGKVTLQPPETLVRQRLKSGGAAPTPLTLRVVQVKTSGHKTALFITTLTDRAKYPLRSIRELYHLRWEEEEFYKLIKELLEAENFRGKSCQFIDQEVMAIYLYCLLVRIMMMETALLYNIPIAEVSQQAAFLAVTRFVDKIWTSSTVEDCERWLTLCLAEISWQRYKKRANRSFPRQSKRSYGKWGNYKA
jgi:hypothetical protein